MNVKPSFDDTAAWLGAKPGGHYVVERWGTRWALIIHRPGRPVETILCDTEGEMNRLRQALSDAGLCGYRTPGA